VSVPVVADVPLFFTLSVYVLLMPMTKLPVCVFCAVSAGAPLTVVGSVAVGELAAPPPDALAELVTLGTALESTLTLTVIGVPLPPAAMTPLEVHVTVCPLALHVQPEPLAELYVSPGGKLSTTVTVPLVSVPPELLGTIVYEPVAPTVKLPVCDFAIASVGGDAMMIVGSFAVAVFVEPPPEATAVFVMVPGDDAVTSTLMSMLGSTVSAGRTVVDVQVTTCPAEVHDQTLPVPASNVSPAGSVSTIVIVPEVGPSPVFASEIV
jgi:hypothetical protein